MDTREKDIENLKDYKYGFTTDIESIKAPKGLNEDVIKFISNIKKEPKWMLDFRLKAFETFKVKVDLLDNYCNEKKITKIDLLKIDVEGSEIDVLEGSSNILKNTNVLLIEIFDKKNKYEKKMSKIKSMLSELNFELKKIKSTWSSQQMSNTKSADALFVKRNISSL